MSSSDQIATVVVNLSGGVVQDVVATESVRVIVVDYDIDDDFAMIFLLSSLVMAAKTKPSSR